MNVIIAAIIKDLLVPLPYFDRAAGLVQTIQSEDNSESKGRTIKFPVEVDLSGGNLMAMVPDDSIKGMFYVEDGGIRPEGGEDYSSDLTIVCWLNPKKISAMVDAVSVNAMADIISALKANINEAPVTRLRFSVTGIPVRSADIFAKYNYQESDTQYLMPPYDFFALKVRASFRLSKSCLTPLNPPTPC